MAQVMEADGLREQADEEAKRALDVCKSAKAPDVRLAKEIEDFRNQLKKGSFYKVPLAVSSVVMAVGAGIFAYAM
ncbi:hypothetical protein JG631_18935, partial [Vibrio cholerae]|uniref:hypothetical protein n=1 Tax=Vibrio cholerae TaxID=666 RepID=UPI0018F07FB5